MAENTFVRSFSHGPAANQPLVGSGVVSATSAVGASSLIGRTGAFMPLATLSGWLVGGSGFVLSEAFVLRASGQPGAPNPNDLSLLGEP